MANNKIWKKGLVFGIVVLLISVTIAPSTAEKVNVNITTPLNNRNTLYVGGSGQDNYSIIQDAIDNASDGDTVYVYNGTYPDNVRINKSISLVGENKNDTIIEGGWGTVVYIDVVGVLVTGFTIRDCGSFYIGGIHISYRAGNTTIIGNVLLKTSYVG